IFGQEISQTASDAERDTNALGNEILMIYYEGRERINDKGHFFETYSPSKEIAFGMPCRNLPDFLETFPAAHVVLLDVDRPALAKPDPSRDEIKGWGDKFLNTHTHVVVMRWARHKEQGRDPVGFIPVLQKQIPQAPRLSKLIDLIGKA